MTTLKMPHHKSHLLLLTCRNKKRDIAVIQAAWSGLQLQIDPCKSFLSAGQHCLLLASTIVTNHCYKMIHISIFWTAPNVNVWLGYGTKTTWLERAWFGLGCSDLYLSFLTVWLFFPLKLYLMQIQILELRYFLNVFTGTVIQNLM